jgi:hypothetical protein
MNAHDQDFEIVAWVRGGESMIPDLANLAIALGLRVDGRTPPERAGDVLVYLANTDRRWLLVLDDVPEPELLAGLPVSGYGRVLITSRHQSGYDAFGDELALDVFDANTALEFLLDRTGRPPNEAAEAATVASALGHLPLALAHVGAYGSADTGVSFGEYLELLEGLPSEELFDTSPELFYEQSVAVTWNTSITAAERQAPLARQALEMAASARLTTMGLCPRTLSGRQSQRRAPGKNAAPYSCKPCSPAA